MDKKISLAVLELFPRFKYILVKASFNNAST